MKIPQLGPPLLVPLEASGGHRRQRERQRSPPAHSSTSMTDVRNVEMTEAGPTLDMGGVAEAVGSVPMECDDRVAVDGEQVVTNPYSPMEDGGPPAHAMRAPPVGSNDRDRIYI